MLGAVLWASIEPVWQAAIAEAWAAYAAGTHAIGAVVTAPDGTIVARGRNRVRDVGAPAGQIHGTRLAHAEVNALLMLPRDADPADLTIWTTLEPCPLCVGAIAVAKVPRVHVAARDPLAGSSELVIANRFLLSRGVQFTGPVRHDVERVLTAIEVEFALRAGWATETHLGLLRAVFPGPVAAAEHAHATGWMWDLALTGATVAEAVDAVASDRLIAEGV